MRMWLPATEVVVCGAPGRGSSKTFPGKGGGWPKQFRQRPRG